mgnify:CR=1 FL=1
MAATKTWKVEIFIGEQDQRTYAEARLMPGQEVTLTGTGVARLNPQDRDVPEIGDELAVAREAVELHGEFRIGGQFRRGRQHRAERPVERRAHGDDLAQHEVVGINDRDAGVALRSERDPCQRVGGGSACR